MSIATAILNMLVGGPAFDQPFVMSRRNMLFEAVESVVCTIPDEYILGTKLLSGGIIEYMRLILEIT